MSDAANSKAFPLANAQLTNQILDLIQQASHVSLSSLPYHIAVQ